MKNNKIIKRMFLLLLAIFLTGCTFGKNNLENAKIYTTSYPINYLTKYFFGEYSKDISSIYPEDIITTEYEISDKKYNDYAKAKLFIYNGLGNEKKIAKEILNRNKNLLIIDATNGITDIDNSFELWLSPANYMLLAKNIKTSLIEYSNSKVMDQEIEESYKDFEEKLSLLDASLHTISKNSKNNTIVVSNNSFKYLESYGFNVISLEDEKNLSENKLNQIKSNFKSKKYKYILLADIDSENELITSLVSSYKATTIKVDTLTTSLTDDYFNYMNEYVENIRKIANS